MVDDLMVCVDRVIASTTCFNTTKDDDESTTTSTVKPGTLALENNNNNNKNNNSILGKECRFEIVECRVCQEEDHLLSMESPCACSGTLKFAHRKCIQKWCNKKGDITCEICNQVFTPNYSSPPVRTSDIMTIDIRQWGSHLDLRDSHLLALAAAEHRLLQSEYDDYSDANSSGIACLCSIAVITLLVVLLVRQTLMITRLAGMIQESSTLFNVSVLQLAGFLLPCYVMARSWFIIQSRRRRQA